MTQEEISRKMDELHDLLTHEEKNGLSGYVNSYEDNWKITAKKLKYPSKFSSDYSQ
jgi:hypothetical protein